MCSYDVYLFETKPQLFCCSLPKEEEETAEEEVVAVMEEAADKVQKSDGLYRALIPLYVGQNVGIVIILFSLF